MPIRMQWAAISDGWDMNIRGDLARSESDLRFYFVKKISAAC